MSAGPTSPTSSPEAGEFRAPVGGPHAEAAAGLSAWTRRVWTDKAIGLIYTHYVHSVTAQLGGASLYGRGAVVEDAVQTLAAFPDLRWLGDEVIGSQEPDGLHLSQRILWQGHGTGYSGYGPPTGQPVTCREIVQRRVLGGRVVEEWRVRDELALLRQLGLDAFGLAADAPPTPPDLHGELVRQSGQQAPPLALDLDPADPHTLPRRLFGQVWNARMLDGLSDLYAEDAAVWLPGDRRLTGPSELAGPILGLLAAFPDAVVSVDGVSAVPDGADGQRVAARWTLQGTHRGPGPYGAPSGRRVRVLGLSHFDVRGGRIEREFTLWDEFALLCQLARPEGGSSAQPPFS